MMRRFFIAAALVGAFALAQDKGPAAAPPKREVVLKVIEVKFADVSGLERTLGQVAGPLGVSVTGNAVRGALIVRGTPEAVAMVEETVKTLDQPPAPKPVPPNVELTVHLLYGTAEEKADSVPQDLAGTVKQLHSLFPYKSYRVLESFILRSRDGQETDMSGSFPNSQNSYQFHFRPSVIPGPAPRTVRMDNLRLGLRFAVVTKAVDSQSKQPVEQISFSDSGINTALDAREGQKVVVGKSNMRGTDDAIILVITPKVIE